MKTASKLVLGSVLVLSTAAGLMRSALWYRYYSERREGREVARKVREFESSHHRLPDALTDVGLVDSERGAGPYYTKVSQDTFSIWYGESLGECYSFSSKTGEWQFSCSI